MSEHDELLARLDTFPAFFSMDGVHWYKSNEIDETCEKAATAIRDLTAKLEAERNAREEVERTMTLYIYGFFRVMGMSVEEAMRRFPPL